MRFILSLLTWYHAEGLGTRIVTRLRGIKVGEDAAGNVFYRNRDDSKRWVIYAGEPVAHAVSPEWHGWLHRMYKEAPSEAAFAHKAWEKPYEGNPSGTALAYAPAGSLRRAQPAERRDYEAWQPE